MSDGHMFVAKSQGKIEMKRILIGFVLPTQIREFTKSKIVTLRAVYAFVLKCSDMVAMKKAKYCSLSSLLKYRL